MAGEALVIVEADVTAIIREERIGGQRLILGDCFAVIQELGRFDACVTDPPYGLGDKWQGGAANTKAKWKLNDGGKNCAWDAETADAAIGAAMARAANAIIWGGNYYELPPVRGWLIWDKIVRNFTSGHMELAWSTLDQPTRAFNYAHGELASEGKFHPTQKPLPLMEWCLGFLPKARSVLDPFMGSGTTLVACQRLGRMGTGIEIDPEYFEVACRRVEEATRQPDLFIAPPEAPTQETLI